MFQVEGAFPTKTATIPEDSLSNSTPVSHSASDSSPQAVTESDDTALPLDVAKQQATTNSEGSQVVVHKEIEPDAATTSS